MAVGPNGDLYIADDNNYVIRRIDNDGIIHRTAGNGSFGSPGAGGPALSLPLQPWTLSVAPDGTIYFIQLGEHRVWRLTTNNQISPAVGTGVPGDGGDGGPAILAELDAPRDVAVGPDGSLYIADYNNHRVRKVTPGGVIDTVAGSGTMVPFNGDGINATTANIRSTDGIAVGPSGTLFIADYGHLRVRAVGSDGIIYTVAGNGAGGVSEDDSYATSVPVPAFDVAVEASGNLIVVESGNDRYRRVSQIVNTHDGVTAITIPSSDGSQVFQFTPEGRHLRTAHALTNVTLYEFSYDPNGLLTGITDRDGRVTTIHRDGSGDATSIEAPFGQITNLTLDPNGYLASITNPAGEAHNFGYTSDGLMLSHVNPRGYSSIFTYDYYGRLEQDIGQGGVSFTLNRTESADGYRVEMSTTLGRTKSYEVEYLADGTRRHTNTPENGVEVVAEVLPSGVTRVEMADGTVVLSGSSPDPRFGMLLPAPSLTVISTGSKVLNIASSRDVTLSDPLDLLSLETQTNLVTINGKSFTTTFDATTSPSTMTQTTQAGRTMVAELNADGRLAQMEVVNSWGLVPTELTYYTSGPHKGRLRTASRTSGAEQRTYEFFYGADGNLQSVLTPIGKTVSLTYDQADRVDSVTFPDLENVRFGYDDNGNVTTLAQPGTAPTPAPSEVHQFEYNTLDLLSAYTPPDVGLSNPSTEFGYNVDRQLDLITRPDGQTIDPEYDSLGQLDQLLLPVGNLDFNYYPNTGSPNPGKLSSVLFTGDNVLSYSPCWSLL